VAKKNESKVVKKSEKKIETNNKKNKESKEMKNNPDMLNAKTSEEKIETPEVEKVEPILTKPEPIETFCGTDFDADPQGTCFAACMNEMPDEFNRCLAHYEACKAFTSKGGAGRKRQKGTTSKVVDDRYYRLAKWEHNKKSQAAIIDHLLEDGVLFTAETLGEALETPATRINAHIYHLRKMHGVDIFKTPEGYFFWDGLTD